MPEISQGLPRAGFGALSLPRTKLALPVLLYMGAVMTPIFIQLGPLNLTLLRIFLVALVVPLAVRLFQGQYGRIYPTDILFCLYIFWMAVSLAMNNPARVIETTGSVGAEFLGGYLIGRAYIRTKADFVAVIRLMALVTAITLPVAILESQTGRSVVIEFVRGLPGLTTYADVNNPVRMGLERAQTFFAHPIHYGLFASMGFTLVYMGLRDVMGTGLRWFYTLAIGTCVFLSLSSGALLSVVMQVGLIAWAAMFDRVERRWLLLAGLFATAYVAVDLLSDRTPIRVFMSYATFSPHNAYWRGIIFEWGMKNVWANPIFGIGLNDWVRPHYMHSGSMDNFWLVTAVRTGIPGFLPLAVGWGLVLWNVGTRDLGSDDKLLLSLRRAWVITFIGLSFSLATVHVWTAVYSYAFFLLGAGFWFLNTEPEGAEPGDAAPDPDAPRSPYTRFPAAAATTTA
ncbi:MAG: O-antigen ligase family protein, partial [Pseudomonadota bacterium]